MNPKAVEPPNIFCAGCCVLAPPPNVNIFDPVELLVGAVLCPKSGAVLVAAEPNVGAVIVEVTEPKAGAVLPKAKPVVELVVTVDPKVGVTFAVAGKPKLGVDAVVTAEPKTLEVVFDPKVGVAMLVVAAEPNKGLAVEIPKPDVVVVAAEPKIGIGLVVAGNPKLGVALVELVPKLGIDAVVVADPKATEVEPNAGLLLLDAPEPKAKGVAVLTDVEPRAGSALVVVDTKPKAGGAVVPEIDPKAGGALVVEADPKDGGALVVEADPKAGGALVVEVDPKAGGVPLVEADPNAGIVFVVVVKPNWKGAVVAAVLAIFDAKEEAAIVGAADGRLTPELVEDNDPKIFVLGTLDDPKANVAPVEVVVAEAVCEVPNMKGAGVAVVTVVSAKADVDTGYDGELLEVLLLGPTVANKEVGAVVKGATLENKDGGEELVVDDKNEGGAAVGGCIMGLDVEIDTEAEDRDEAEVTDVEAVVCTTDTDEVVGKANIFGFVVSELITGVASLDAVLGVGCTVNNVSLGLVVCIPPN